MSYRWTFTAILVSISTAVIALGEVQDGYPSQEAAKQRGDMQALATTLAPLQDLRTLFADRTLIEGRENRSVCVFDGFARGKGVREIPVGAGTTVKDVLMKVGMNGWSGRGAQIKIIKRNEIIQSSKPITSPGVTPQVENFLQTKIAPGDFIFLSWQI